MARDVNPTGLEWRDLGHKRYAMCRVTNANRTIGWSVFGRVERDATGQLVASCTQFEHIKYVSTFEEGVQHVDAIWCLE